MKKSLVTLFFILLFLIGWSITPALFLCLFPGVLLLFYPPFKKISLIESLTLIPITSLATVIVVFGLLKCIPLSFSWTLKGIFIISFLLFLFFFWQKKIQLHIEKRELIYFALLVPIFFLFGQLFFDQIVPAGADMATHSYIAKTIQYYDTFPQTYEPIVPMEHFGFEPVGMPSIMASISLLSNMPVYQSGVLISVLMYPFMGVLMYAFLRLFFKELVALLTVYGLFFVNHSFTSYLHFGAHPTVLGILFFTLASYYAVRTFREKNFHTKNALILAILLAASLLSHPIPFVAGGYFTFVATLFAFYSLRKNRSLYTFIATTTVLFILFTLSLITSIKPVSSETFSFIQDWQRNKSLLENIDNSVFTIVPDYISGKTGIEWSLFILAGFLVSLKIYRKETKWFLIALGIYGLILLNTDYWILPFSPLLYPGRTTSSGALIFCYFVALAIEHLIAYIHSIFTSKTKKTEKCIRITLFSMILGFFSLQVSEALQKNFSYVVQNFREATSVTDSDLKVMEWISQNTQEKDVIQNNYGDAGIWIPAIAGRKVIHNDASPHSFDALADGSKNLHPTYAFIGEKILYPDHIYLTEEFVQKNKYQLVLQVGGSKLYRIPPREATHY